jgi:hypothetical protein
MDIVLKYGSKARGDSDSYSDNDFLVVGNIPRDAKYNGFDVVRYTKNRLEKIKEKESLFLIHLREEGIIIKDQNNWMANFLKGIPDYTPSDSVIDLAYQNLSSILSIIPSISGIPCWFDMVFVFLRDLLVKLNATKKHYVFAPEVLLENIDIKNKNKLKRIFAISRQIKSNYRNGLNQNIFINPLEVSELLSDSFRIEKFSLEFKDLIKNAREYDPYLVLRLVEYGISTEIFRPTNEKIETYIKNPHRYSWHIKQVKWIDNLELVEPIRIDPT